MKAFQEFVQSCVGHDQYEDIWVHLSPTVSLLVSPKSHTLENVMTMRRYLLAIIGPNQSADIVSLATADDMPMGNLTARTVIAIGRVFNLWNIVPMDIPNDVFRETLFGAVPRSLILTTPIDKFNPEYDGSLKYDGRIKIAA
jgi:hypothetical protein